MSGALAIGVAAGLSLMPNDFSDTRRYGDGSVGGRSYGKPYGVAKTQRWFTSRVLRRVSVLGFRPLRATQATDGWG
jgi:hypothetical protein